MNIKQIAKKIYFRLRAKGSKAYYAAYHAGKYVNRSTRTVFRWLKEDSSF